ncbi:PREDICTED: uncharacterized protein LOC106807778 isoform X2 [Priapulus caudatus]|uniref:Uncharacterized protein LOC106807778 isoform X2 n=1 Tax=Priapulus caudatus TaxID=37621 RepID=A0ABM1E0K2_PRICU|nr:PREDICTED: uncharacterized protein LOC106807778 isoform X2 [Priapulus caudatus]
MWTQVNVIVSASMNAYFDPYTPRNVTTELDETIFMQCRVHNLDGKTQVSWIRRHDLQILTIGEMTFTPDKRFRVIHESGSTDWTLQLKHAKQEDAGIYECQVSSNPTVSLLVSLTILRSEVAIHGNFYVQLGSPLKLRCNVTASPSPPVRVYWYHNDSMIQYDQQSQRTQVFYELTEYSTTSILIVQDAKRTDSGKYTCKANSADNKSADVVVTNGKHTQAIVDMSSQSSSTSAAVSLSGRLYTVVAGLLLSLLLTAVQRGCFLRSDSSTPTRVRGRPAGTVRCCRSNCQRLRSNISAISWSKREDRLLTSRRVADTAADSTADDVVSAIRDVVSESADTKWRIKKSSVPDISY